MAQDRKPTLSPSQEIAAGAPPSEREESTPADRELDWETRTGGPHTESRYGPKNMPGAVREVDRHAGRFHGSSTPDNLETTTPPRRRE